MIRHHTQHCFEQAIGSAGLDEATFRRTLEMLRTPLARLGGGHRHDAQPLLDIAGRRDDLPAIRSIADEIRSESEHVVVAGAGGSSLSGRVAASLAHLHHRPALHFLDNIDPDAIDQLLARIDARRSYFLIISKSGTTVETLGHLHVLLAHARQSLAAGEIARRFLLITMPGDNPMRRTAQAHGMRVLDHAADIGGRFSLLSNVGLLPAAIAGLDIEALRAGAGQIVDSLKRAPDPGACESACGAAIQYGFMQRGYNISVMLPYSERLAGFSSWYRQSWAESLGKAGKGSTPIRAVGTTDQHSQLQLYLDGPKDKLFHLITLPRAGSGQKIAMTQDDAFSYLHGRTTGDIMESQQKATLETLLRHGCPVRHIEIERLDGYTLGALVMHFTLEIIFTAELLGINPFDQPAVEESKQIARRHMGGI